MKEGYGFWDEGKYFFLRCYECERENWACSVASGQCAWCGSTKHPRENEVDMSEIDIDGCDHVG